jgi:hypothetical protein
VQLEGLGKLKKFMTSSGDSDRDGLHINQSGVRRLEFVALAVDDRI